MDIGIALGVIQAVIGMASSMNSEEPEKMPKFSVPQSSKDALSISKRAYDESMQTISKESSLAKRQTEYDRIQNLGLAREYGRSPSEILGMSMASSRDNFDKELKVQAYMSNEKAKALQTLLPSYQSLAQFESMKFDYDYKNTLIEIERYNQEQQAASAAIQAGLSNVAQGMTYGPLNETLNNYYGALTQKELAGLKTPTTISGTEYEFGSKNPEAFGSKTMDNMLGKYGSGTYFRDYQPSGTLYKPTFVVPAVSEESNKNKETETSITNDASWIEKIVPQKPSKYSVIPGIQTGITTTPSSSTSIINDKDIKEMDLIVANKLDIPTNSITKTTLKTALSGFEGSNKYETGQESDVMITPQGQSINVKDKALFMVVQMLVDAGWSNDQITQWLKSKGY